MGDGNVHVIPEGINGISETKWFQREIKNAEQILITGGSCKVDNLFVA